MVQVRRPSTSSRALVAIAVVATALRPGARALRRSRCPANAQPSAIYDANGTLITVLQEENRHERAARAGPRSLQDAVVAIEDARFWTHNGVDPQGGGPSSGAQRRGGRASPRVDRPSPSSTSRTRCSPRNRRSAARSRRPPRPWRSSATTPSSSSSSCTSTRSTWATAPTGSLQQPRSTSASRSTDLTLAQSALIAGVIQAPSRHDPRTDPDAAVQRRNLVLRRMAEQQLITEQQADRCGPATPLVLAPEAPTRTGALRRAALRRRGEELAPEPNPTRWATAPAERREQLLRGGLRIDTTIDLGPAGQGRGGDPSRSYPGQGTDPRTPDAALVSIEPRTGFVRAMVGGYDYFGTHSYRQTNLAAGAGRQTGSAFKPIVMATALENGVSPTKRFDAPSSAVLTIPGGIWRVKGGGIGAGTMAECTVVSSNTCYANIMLDPAVGPSAPSRWPRSSVSCRPRSRPTPDRARRQQRHGHRHGIGLRDLRERRGRTCRPRYVTKITGPDGAVVYQHSTPRPVPWTRANVREIAPALEGVIQRGTGRSANIGRPAGGKTGSAQNNTDAWFCGYTQQLSTSVWVGLRRAAGGGGRHSANWCR